MRRRTTTLIDGKEKGSLSKSNFIFSTSAVLTHCARWGTVYSSAMNNINDLRRKKESTRGDLTSRPIDKNDAHNIMRTVAQNEYLYRSSGKNIAIYQIVQCACTWQIILGTIQSQSKIYVPSYMATVHGYCT